MPDRDLFILAVYLLCVTYVLYRAINSIDKQVTIQLDQGLLSEQLQAQNLQELVSFKFDFKKRYQFDDFKELPISITNQSKDGLIEVNWEYSSMTDFEGRSRRVIRILPGMPLDLIQAQVASVIAPSRTLKEKLTAEDILKRDSEAGALKISNTLVDLSKLKKDRSKTFQFSLRLCFRLINPMIAIAQDSGFPLPTGGDRLYIILCQFTVQQVPWTETLPWNQPKKS